MGRVLYKRVDCKLENLILEIESGRLGLPDIQRPFVWQNTKVRELFDSMMRGYPIGYLMMWDAPVDMENNRQIGTIPHSYTAPKQLIIDGQQRLTSLFAVMRGVEVMDSGFNKRNIPIAFHPIQRKFEVTSAAHRKSAEWIPDITDVFRNGNNAFKYTNDFIHRLSEVRVKDGSILTQEEQQTIAGNIQDLLNLKDYTIPILDISEEADEEAVAEIFVRVNSGGKSLNENDFILTLISVHDEAERRRIERFCYEATIPVSGGTSYNQLFSPKPSHIVRAVMAYGFKRARLRYAYMLLRGRDMKTETYSTELRDKMFMRLKKRLDEVLDLNNWHEFIHCVMSAGYFSRSLIASENALVYTYVMYLIGKYDFGVEAAALRKLVSQWFYMVSVTAYYSTSTETTVQADLNAIEELENTEDFFHFIASKINSVFTNDYFEISLPNELNSSAAISPAWYGYCAAQNVLDSSVLFSFIPMRNLFAPGASGTKMAIEKHHLFPKAWLSRKGITKDRDRNRIANFAYIEWKDNLEISDEEPARYWQKLSENFSNADVKKMMADNALPDNWFHMDYFAFLAERRKRMARIIRKGYERLKQGPLV